MYAVEVTFQKQEYESQMWTYLVHDSIMFHKGNMVVVSVLEDSLYKVAIVRNIIEKPKLKPGIHYRWVVQKICFETYKKCLYQSNVIGI